VNDAEIGMTPQADGNYQVTYNHHPLYLYDREVIALNASDHLVNSGSSGNGRDERGPGGVMSAVSASQ
jgi:hypothetical protein